MTESQDALVVYVPEFVQIDPELTKVGPKPAGPFNAPVNAPRSLDLSYGDVPLNRGVLARKPRLKVVSLPSLDAAPHQLDVLLRQRLLPQSHGFEGLLMAEVVH